MKRIYITLFALTFSVGLFAQSNDKPTIAKLAKKTDTTKTNANMPKPEIKKAEKSTVPNENEQKNTSEEPKIAPAAKNPQ